MIGFIAPYTELGTTGNTVLSLIYTHYSSPLHTYYYSVFISHILATDISQSHCNFKSHMKSSFRNLIPFLPLFCSFPFRILEPSSYPGRQTSRNPTLHFRFLSILPNTSSQSLCTDPKENIASIVKEACILICCLAMDILFLLTLSRAGMCLSSRCLAMVIHVRIFLLYLISKHFHTAQSDKNNSM
jgi:hypothetical protein